MKWEHAAIVQIESPTGEHPPYRITEAPVDKVIEILDGMGKQGWEFAATVGGVLIFKRVVVEGDVEPTARPGYQGELDTSGKEKVLYVRTHQNPGITLGASGVPEMSVSECKHIHDALLIEEHPAATKIALLTGSEHGGRKGDTFWVQRKDVRFIARGEAVPELTGSDPEESALRRMIDGG